MKPKPTWICIDIETDGNCPGLNSMISLGAVALNDDLQEIGSFYETLKPMAGAKPDPQTTAWWEKQEKLVYEAARLGARHPQIVMQEFKVWIESFGGEPYSVMSPVGFDWPFVYYYFARYCKVESLPEGGGITGNPFGFRTRDLRTMAHALTGVIKQKSRWPARWKNKALPHTHIAIDDARKMAYTFAQIMREIRSQKVVASSN